MDQHARTARELASKFQSTSRQLDACFVRAIGVGDLVTSDGAREHLKYGVGRRFGILRKDLEYIGGVASPYRAETLTADENTLFDLHLNSLYLHVRGSLDNLAWCLAHEFEILGPVPHGDSRFRRRIGLFLSEFRSAFPGDLADSRDLRDRLDDWHRNLTNIRDPVAHRIPLYAVPAVLNREEAERYKALAEEVNVAISSFNPERANRLMEEQGRLGRYLPVFAHSFREDPIPRPILPSVCEDLGHVCDIATCIFDSLEKRGAA